MQIDKRLLVGMGVFACWAMVTVGTGCKGDEPAAPTTTPEAAPAPEEPKGSPVKPDAPELASYDDWGKTETSLKELFAYVKENKTADDINETVASLARVSLDAVVAGTVEGADGKLSAGLGEDAAGGVAAWSKNLGTILEGRTGVAYWAEGKAAVDMIGAAEGGSSKGDPDAFLKAVQGSTPVAPAARAYALWSLNKGVESLATDSIRTKSAEVSTDFLGSREALVVSRVGTGPLLSSGAVGAVCPEARAQVKGKSEAEAMALIQSTCPASYYGLASKDGLKALTEANVVPIRLMGLMGQVLHTPSVAETDPMHKTVTSVTRSVESKAKSASVALSIPIGTSAAADENAFRLPEVEQQGNAFTETPLDTVVIDEAGVRLALRPVMSLSNEGVVFQEQKSGYGYPGKVGVTAENLLTPPEAVEGVPAPADVFQTELKSLRVAAEGLDAKAAGALKQAPDAPSTALLALDGKVKSELLGKAIPALVKAGYGRAHLVTGERGTIPVVIGDVAGAGASAQQHFDRPVIVQLTGEGVNVFPPKGKRVSAPAGAGKAVWLAAGKPEGTQPWYQYETLFKVTLPPTATPTDIAVVAQDLGGSSKAGNVVFLEAGEGVDANRIVQAAGAINASEGTPIADISAFPGMNCTEGNGCPTRVVVMMTGSRIPSARNLTKEPTKKEVAPPPPPAPPKASPQFCNKKDIEKVMRGKKSAFKFCYERVKQAKPGLGGPMTVKFEIPANGKASGIRMGKANLTDGGKPAPKTDVQKIFKCVKSHIGKVTFQKPDGGVCAVRWPFKFQ